MTLPGGIQAILCLATSVYAYIFYLKRRDNIVIPLSLGLFLFTIGIIIQALGSGSKETIYDLIAFNAKNIHQGIVASSMGIGIFFGSLVAWIVFLIKK